MDELKKVFDAARAINGHTIKQTGNRMGDDVYSIITLDHFFTRVWEWFRTLPKASKILADNNITIGRPPSECQGDAIQQGDKTDSQELKGEPIDKWRTKGVPIPESLRTEAFKEKIEEYWPHLMSMYKM